MYFSQGLKTICFTGLAIVLVLPVAVTSADTSRIQADKRRVIEHWTPERRAAAIPRDLRIDERGQGYLRQPDGSLQPYGRVRADLQLKRGKPSGANDTTPPTINDMDPAEGVTIPDSYTFSARVTDDLSGIKSVAFTIVYPSGQTQSFNPSFVGNDIWQVTLSGFSDGDWAWQVVAKDGASKGGNTASSDIVSFYVGSGGSSTGGDGYIVANAPWEDYGSAVQTAAGRIYFEMPSNPKWKRWSGYVCSGTVAMDQTTGRSVIITAAHCVYDDSNKAFARNVLFVPNQDATTGSGTDLNCNNDPLGCWVPSFGVVDANWTVRTFPDNIEWDYAYYVVSDQGAHAGTGTTEILDTAADSLAVDFSAPEYDDGVPAADSSDFTQALGYSYSDDPNFMYCAEDMTREGQVNWWLPSCGLSGGSSGGPWKQPNAGDRIISVNSWGYTTSPGMAGPKLNGTSASCLFDLARSVEFSTVSSVDGEAGVASACSP